MIATEMQIPDIAPNHARSMLEGALYYAAQGMSVHPLEADGKRPRTKWKESATDDPVQIRAWWTKPGWEDSNIGLVTGKKNDLIVVDIDRKDGSDGLRSYQAISQEKYTGPMAVTPGGEGGRHLLFTYKENLTNFVHMGVASGLDLRADAGFIVVSPSRIGGKQYYWASTGAIPEMPPRLYAACLDWSKGGNQIKKVEMPEPADIVPPLSSLNLVPKYLNYLHHGDASPWNDDGSAALMAVAGAVLRSTGDEKVMFSVLTDNPHVIECAARHRPRDPEGWLWEHTCVKSVDTYKASLETNFDVDNFFTKIEDVPDDSQPADPLDAFLENTDQNSIPKIIPTKDEPKGPFFISAKDGLKTQLQPTQWLIKGVLEKGQVGFLYGDSTVGKTFAALDMALHVSGGLAWHKHKIKNPGPVLYINGEGGGGIWRRINTWFAGYNDQHKADRGFKPVNADSMEHDMLLANTTVDLANGSSMAPINEWVESTRQHPALIVIDTLSTNMTGNENDSGDIARALKVCIGMAKTWGTTVLIVHHTNKAGDLRGSGAIFNNSDFVLHMENVEGAKVKTSRLSVTKSKDGEPATPLFFELTKHYMIDVEDDEGAPMSSMYLKRVSRRNSGVDVKTQVRVSKTEAEVLGLAIEHIQDSCMLDPTATLQANSEELWPVYLAYCRETYGEDKVPKRRQFNAMLMSLTKKGHLHAVDEPGGPWYEMSKSDKKE